MSFDLTCPHCAKSMRVPDEMMGRLVACPHCARQFHLPTAPPKAPAPLPIPLEEVPPEAPPSPPLPAVPSLDDPFGFAPGPGAPDEPDEPMPTFDRDTADDLPEPWPAVYRGFRLLQAASLIAGVGLLGVGVTPFAVLVLQAGKVFPYFLPSFAALGVGVLVALVGHTRACSTPARFGGAAAASGLKVFVAVAVVGWGVFPLALLVYALIWRRFLADLARRLEDDPLRAAADRLWWAGAAASALTFGALVALVSGPRLLRGLPDPKLAAAAVAAVLVGTAAVLGAVFAFAAHAAAARAVLRKAPEQPPEELERPGRRRKRLRDEDEEEFGRKTRRRPRD